MDVGRVRLRRAGPSSIFTIMATTLAMVTLAATAAEHYTLAESANVVEAVPLFMSSPAKKSGGKNHFKLENMARSAVALSAAQDKLYIGGTVTEGNTAVGQAALAMLDLESNQLDFAKSYALAYSVVAISELSNNEEDSS